MPFTFSHPAVVLPLINKRIKLFSPTGLIIGSIIPDFESFIKLDERKIYSHTWLGMFWYDLPLAIIAAFVFHNIVRDPLISSLPRFIENKFKRFIGFKWNPYFRKHYLMILYSMLIGIAMHLLWDAFTHLNLAHPDSVDSDLYARHVWLFKMLQDSDSVLGLIIVAVYIFMMPDTSNAVVRPREKMIFYIEKTPKKYAKMLYWALVLIIAASTVFLATTLLPRQMNLILFIDINISGILLGIIIASIFRKAA